MNSAEDVEWITSKEALARVLKKTGSRSRALTALNRAGFDGKLEAIAFAELKEIDFGPVPIELPERRSKQQERIRVQEEGRPINLAAGFWRARGITLHFEPMRNWEHGVFGFADPVPDRLLYDDALEEWQMPVPFRWIFYDVHFRADQIETLISEVPGSRGRAGRRKPQYNWAPVMAELESLLESGQTMIVGVSDPDVRGAKARIAKHMEHWFASQLPSDPDGKQEGPSDSSLYRHAEQFLEIWRRHLRECR